MNKEYFDRIIQNSQMSNNYCYGTYSTQFQFQTVPIRFAPFDQPIAPPLRRCDYCGTKYYEKQKENEALTCPSCGGPR